MSTSTELSFLYLNRENRWAGFHRSGLVLDDAGALRLASLPLMEGPLPPELSALEVPAAPAGVAIDLGGTLYFTDPDGLLMQIQDVTYCGGGGVLGSVCPPL